MDAYLAKKAERLLNEVLLEKKICSINSIKISSREISKEKYQENSPGNADTNNQKDLIIMIEP